MSVFDCFCDHADCDCKERRQRPRLEKAGVIFFKSEPGVPHYYRDWVYAFHSDEWIEYIPEPTR